MLIVMRIIAIKGFVWSCLKGVLTICLDIIVLAILVKMISIATQPIATWMSASMELKTMIILLEE